MRPSVADDWGIKELQNCILNIAKYIHDFCEENDIKYCIMGGTALGAVRHGGFIPWDDDIDLFMTPDEYARFRSLFLKKGDHTNYYLQEKGVYDGVASCAKLRMNGTTFIEDLTKEWDIHQGIFVDIMILKSFPDGWFSRGWMVFWEKYLYVKAAAEMNYNRRGKLINYALLPFRWLPKRFLCSYGTKQIRRYQNKECGNYFHYYISMPLSHSIYPKKLFESYELMDFETIKLRVPTGVRDYLRILFGDYMKIPDLNQIRFRQHTNDWSVEKSFKRNGKGTFEDEKYY